MSGMRRICALMVLGQFLAGSARGEIIAEFDGGPTSNALAVSSTFTHAMAFDVSGNPTVTEIQLKLRRWSGTTGYVMMQLRPDSNGSPSTGMVAQISKPVSDVPSSAAEWFSFKWFSSGTTISPGRWWIVCKVSSYSDAHISWQVLAGNSYGTGDDTKTSKDGGSTWPILQGADAYFKVFGARTSESTTTTVTASPATVATSGVSTIQVTVRDSLNNLVQGPGTVNLVKTGGTLGQTTLTLSNGQATTTWTAPGSTGSQTVTANYQGHSYGGVDYGSSSGNTNINVVAQQRATTTTLNLNPSTTTTRSSINVSITVRDDQNNLVPGGTVSLTCSTGTFGSDSLAVVNGQASTTWTAGNTAGTFAIDADYSGFDSGSIVYGASSDSDNVIVDYTNVATTTTVRVSPDYPYKGKSAYVMVEVKDGGGNLVPGGSVQLSAPSGWFNSSNITLSGGMGSTQWHAPTSTGAVLITGNYQQYIAAGNRYQASSGNDTANVVKDNDSTGDSLQWMSDWISDYSSNPLPNSRPQSRGFTNKIVSELVWAGAEYANDNAWEDDMKKSSKGGQENSYMDVHDFTWYNGHGNPDYITFITDHDDRHLRHSDAYDAWGTKDAEWLAIKSCKVMSHDSYWASTMNGIHLECGFHTNAQSTTDFGEVFAGFMIKENVYDEPHKIHQAWFLAGDQTHDPGYKQRVIGESGSMFNDHIWGQGYVSADPTVDNYYSSRTHDTTALNFPTSNANGPYNAVAGQPVQLDGSGSSDPDVGDYLFYAWDMDTATNTDSGDWDVDGIDENSDDADVWGRRPQYVYSTPGFYNIRLMVIDDDWQAASSWTSVNVTASAAPGGSRSGPRNASTNGEIEIVDDFPGLPPEVQMPLVFGVGTTLGYNELMSVAAYYGVEGSAGLDGLGNWNMTQGDHDLIVNQHSAAVMYVDRARAYVFNTNGPPPVLPSETQAIQAANAFLDANNIQRVGAVVDSVTDMFAEQTEKGSRSRISRIPFQRRVNYRRTINVMGQPYPVVGPGGKITVMMDEYADVLLFVKVWREAYPQDEVLLYPPALAIADFHRLGLKALIGGSWVPPCHRIEIDNVSVGYYEHDFVTPQNILFPVYVLDLTCEDDVGSQQVQVYLPAVSPPIEPTIDAPSNGFEVPYGTPIAFSGSSTNGIPPYSYEWHSDVDGLLSTNGSFSATLSVNLRTGEVRAHTISFRVTDQTGFFAEERVRVTVLPPTGDLDGDGDVDLDDYQLFAACLAGPDVTSNGPGCTEGQFGLADLEGDGDVDLRDFAMFQVLYTGPGVCGNGFIEGGEECDDGGESAVCDADCTFAQCGDGTTNVTAGEECDDGGESAVCDADCTVASCGDGTINVTAGEECDDGGESAVCDADCTVAVCGDGTLNVTAGEECDDGGESASCDADCTVAQCGDGTINVTAGEECDDGGESAVCDADCTVAECGDGTTNGTAGEECDDGGESATCDADCTFAACGDGTVNATAGEECDDGGESATCDADCTFAECGDGTLNVTAGEECDDGNTNGGDGCSADCQIEEPPLPECVIPFDPPECPNTIAVCGASFSGGGDCMFEESCADTPPFAYQFSDGGPLLITLAGDLNTLSVLFSGFGGSSGVMEFFDVDGLPVDAPLFTNGDCVSGPPPPQVAAFSRPVRTIQVTAMGGPVWIDTFHVNPP